MHVQLQWCQSTGHLASKAISRTVQAFKSSCHWWKFGAQRQSCSGEPAARICSARCPPRGPARSAQQLTATAKRPQQLSAAALPMAMVDTFHPQRFSARKHYRPHQRLATVSPPATACSHFTIPLPCLENGPLSVAKSVSTHCGCCRFPSYFEDCFWYPELGVSKAGLVRHARSVLIRTPQASGSEYETLRGTSTSQNNI